MATPRSNIVKLRLTDLEKADWQKAAGGQRLLSDFIRRTVNTECARLRGGEIAAEPLLHEPVVEATKEALLPGSHEHKAEKRTLAPKPIRESADDCPRAHAHRPGVYCGTCKTVAKKVGE